MVDQLTETVLDALKQALAAPGEVRLFRSGKLDGLFPGRGGVNAAAATRALGDGLLEVVRTETKGKTRIEWVRLTPRGLAFLHDHESPVRALHELREAVRSAQDGLPEWVAGMRRDLAALGDRLAADSERLQRRLDALGQRVEEALRRLEARGPDLPKTVLEAVPWSHEALAHLDRRRAAGAADGCPLPELFEAVRAREASLSITAFHDGLRRLHEQRALRLLPFTGPPTELGQPEYALFDGAGLYYHATR